MGQEATFFSADTAIRGYHVYKDVWYSSVGELLVCEIENSNRYDSNAVAIKKNGNIVGHVPRNISLACTLFLRRNHQ